MSGKSDLHDFYLHKHAETERAILVSETGDRDKAVWLPKSQIEVSDGPNRLLVEVAMPEWLAVEKGLF